MIKLLEAMTKVADLEAVVVVASKDDVVDLMEIVVVVQVWDLRDLHQNIAQLKRAQLPAREAAARWTRQSELKRAQEAFSTTCRKT